MPGLKLMAELGLDGSSFAAGFHKAKGLAEGAGEGLKGLVIGAIGVGTVEEAIRRTVETAKELVEASERLAIAPEQLQVMRQAAKNANVDFEKLVETMEKLSVAREEALIPGKEGQDARRAFAAAGIHSGQLHSMTNQQMLLGPIRDMVLGKNPEQIGIVFRELGIKAFGGLIPLLKTNFDELAEKMKNMGAIMDTQTAVKLKAMDEEFSLISKVIVSQVGPALVRFAEWLYRVMLTGGGNLAAGSAAIGAGTATQSPWSTITSSVSAMGHIVSHTLGFISDREYEKRMAPLFDWNAADQAADAALKPWEAMVKQLDELLQEMKNRAEELNNPKHADLSGPTIHPKLPRKALVEQSDSLVKIGNFLGGNDRVINRLQEKQVYWLEKIHGKISTNHGYLSGMQFPLPGAVSSVMMGPHFPHN